jgi:energy-coupling factor transporter transmembrane protein EcfT
MNPQLKAMLSIHPFAHVLSLIFLLLAVFGSMSLYSLLCIYIFTLLLLFAGKIHNQHMLFICVSGIPFLAGSILIWLMSRISNSSVASFSYSLITWLRIVVSAGIFQSYLLPIFMRPLYLKSYIKSLKLSGDIAILIVSAVLFIPEIKRRYSLVIDATKVQGNYKSGFRALFNLPYLLMPLVASLLDISVERASLWQQRGIIERYTSSDIVLTYNYTKSLSLTLTAFLAFMWSTGFVL